MFVTWWLHISFAQSLHIVIEQFICAEYVFCLISIFFGEGSRYPLWIHKVHGKSRHNRRFYLFNQHEPLVPDANIQLLEVIVNMSDLNFQLLKSKFQMNEINTWLLVTDLEVCQVDDQMIEVNLGISQATIQLSEVNMEMPHANFHLMKTNFYMSQGNN